MFDLDSKIQHWVNRLSFILRAEAQQRLKQAGFDLTAEEWALMMILWKGGPTPMAKLAEATLRDRTTVTRLVDRLIRKAYVERKAAPKDRRQVIVSVSQMGEAIKPEVMRAMLPLIERSSKGISEVELAQAMAVLQRMYRNMEGERL